MANGGNVFFFDGMEEALKILDELPRSISRQTLTNAAAIAARPIRKDARNIIWKRAKGSDEGLSKAGFVGKGVTIIKSKANEPPGARVGVSGPKVPVKGSRYGFWNLKGYAKLLSAGAYKTPKRKGKGEFKGFGNFILEAAKKNLVISRRIFEDNLLTEMKKAVDKTIKRYGKRRR